MNSMKYRYILIGIVLMIGSYIYLGIEYMLGIFGIWIYIELIDCLLEKRINSRIVRGGYRYIVLSIIYCIGSGIWAYSMVKYLIFIEKILKGDSIDKVLMFWLGIVFILPIFLLLEKKISL